MRGAASVSFTDSFKRDFSRLAPELQALVKGCIADMQQDPMPGARRAHSVTPRGQKPTIYTVDVTTNKAYKLSFQMEAVTAILRRIGTHKEIDRHP